MQQDRESDARAAARTAREMASKRVHVSNPSRRWPSTVSRWDDRENYQLSDDANRELQRYPALRKPMIRLL